MSKPTPEILARRYAAAERRWYRAHAAARRAEETMKAAALAAVPLPDGTPDGTRYCYEEFIHDEVRNQGSGPTYATLAEFIPALQAFIRADVD